MFTNIHLTNMFSLPLPLPLPLPLQVPVWPLIHRCFWPLVWWRPWCYCSWHSGDFRVVVVVVMVNFVWWWCSCDDGVMVTFVWWLVLWPSCPNVCPYIHLVIQINETFLVSSTHSGQCALHLELVDAFWQIVAFIVSCDKKWYQIAFTCRQEIDIALWGGRKLWTNKTT